MALSDPQGVVGFGRLIYPHSSALRASNEGYDKSDLLAEVLIYRHSDEYSVEATSHTTSNLVIFATKKEDMRKLRSIMVAALLLLFVSPQLLAEGEQLRVMTFNIRYDNKGDSAQQWSLRKAGVAQILNSQAIDLLGAQEVLKNQLDDLVAMLPHHNFIGVGRDDGKEAGEYAPLFYDTRRFQLKEGGYFWLSETPEVASIGWDAACARIVTWGYFYDREAQQELVCFNLHLDHVGKVARRESLALLTKHIAPFIQAQIPVIVMGDFNAAPSEELMQHPLPLLDSYLESPVKEGPSWSFHNFGRIPLPERQRIDYIFYSPLLAPINYQSIHPSNEEGVCFLSDHTPVVVTFGYNGERKKMAPTCSTF